MRYITVAILVIIVATAYSCKQKVGMHRVVDFSEQINVSEEVQTSFLLDQIERNPKSTDSYLKLAEIYKAQGDIVSGISILEKAGAKVPNSLTVLAELGSFFLQQNDADRLASTLSKIRKIDPEHHEYLKLSAGYSLLEDDYSNSLFYSNRAMLTNPYDDENYFLRGEAQLMYKDSLSALESFVQAYELKGRSRYFSEIYDIAMARNNFDLAYNYLSDFSSTQPDAELCLEWASYFRAVNRSDTSRQILRNCLSHRPDEARTYFELARAYISERGDSALVLVDQYLAMAPDAVDGMMLKARLLERRNNYSEARRYYQMAIETDSTFTIASNALENLERKVAYLRLIRRREEIERQTESLNQLNPNQINQ